MVNADKKNFLEKEFMQVVRTVNASMPPRWGKMNAQQMIEHVAGFFSISSGKINFPVATPVELLPKYRQFLMSEKQFRENTRAPNLPDHPLQLRFATMDAAINDLEKEVTDFFAYYSIDHERKTAHPAFGELNFEEWIQLHHKHVMHHLKQFGVDIPAFNA